MENLTKKFQDWNTELLQERLTTLIQEAKSVDGGIYLGVDQNIVLASDYLEPGGAAHYLILVSQSSKRNPDFKIGHNYVKIVTVEEVLKKAGLIIYDPQNI